MICVSPCGWYCYELDDDTNELKVTDTQEKTIIIGPENVFEIVLLSARKKSEAIDDEISQIHEDYLAENSIIPNRTIL